MTTTIFGVSSKPNHSTSSGAITTTGMRLRAHEQRIQRPPHRREGVDQQRQRDCRARCSPPARRPSPSASPASASTAAPGCASRLDDARRRRQRHGVDPRQLDIKLPGREQRQRGSAAAAATTPSSRRRAPRSFGGLPRRRSRRRPFEVQRAQHARLRAPPDCIGVRLAPSGRTTDLRRRCCPGSGLMT